VGWTDAAPPNVFVELAAGRCPFRIDDLISLAGLLQDIRRPPQAGFFEQEGHSTLD
jgi:hypothetical protein